MRLTIVLVLAALAVSSQAQDAAPTIWPRCGADVYDSFKSHHGELSLAAPDSHRLPRVSLSSTNGVGCVLSAPGIVSDGYGYSLFVDRSTGRSYLKRFGGLDGSWTYFGPTAVELSDLTMRSISGRAANDAARQ